MALKYPDRKSYMTLRRNVVANYLGQGWVALMSLAFIPIYIRYLGIEAFGLIGLFAALQAWLGLLDMGMNQALGREMARFTSGSSSVQYIRDLLRSIVNISMLVALVIAAGLALASELIASQWLNTVEMPASAVSNSLVIMGLVTALRFVEGVYRSAVIGLQRQVLFNVVNSTMATMRGIGAICILVLVSPTIGAFFLWQAVVSIATLAALAAATYATLPPGDRGDKFSLMALKSVWRFAGGMFVVMLLATLIAQLDKILLSNLLTLSEFGYYSLATTVAGALYMLIGPIIQALYPRLCAYQASGDTNGLADSYHKGAQLVSVIFGSFAIVLIFFSEIFLELWTQDSVLAGRVAKILSLLVLGNLLAGMMWIPYIVQFAHEKTKLLITVHLVAVSIFVPAMIWIVPEYGTIGAAWIWVFINAGYIVVAVQLLHRKVMTAEKWRWYVQDVLAPLLAASFTVGLLKWAWPAQSTLLDKLMALTIAGIVAVVASAFASSHIRTRMLVSLRSVFTRCHA